MAGKNIVLILTDQQRYDMVGVNGSKICRTDTLDKLAQEGVNFSSAYSCCGLCSPTRASIYTGLLPHRHGITRNVTAGDPLKAAIPKETATLAERLETLGYESQFLGKWHAGERLPTDAGFTGMDVSGYGVVTDHPDYIQYLEEKGLEKPGIEAKGAGWAHQLTLAGLKTGPVEASVPYFLADRAVDFLKRKTKDGGPFLLCLNFWGPHAPYLPSEPYASMYDPEDIEPWPNFYDTFENKPPIYKRYRDAFIGEGASPRSWEECARWAALYYGFMTQIDDQIGRVMQYLDAAGLSDDTAVICSTDHGDLCGAHGGMHDKDGIMVQEVYHIPLIARLPGGAENTRCGLPINNMDIPRTVLDLAGYGDTASLDGRSLLPILEGSEPPDWPDYTVSEYFGAHFAYETRMIIHNGFKYVFHPGAFDEIYDLTSDPWEMENLIASAEHRPVLEACRRRLIDWAKKTGDELCVLCGLFHQRLSGDLAPYSPKSMDALRKSETRLL